MATSKPADSDAGADAPVTAPRGGTLSRFCWYGICGVAVAVSSVFVADRFSETFRIPQELANLDIMSASPEEIAAQLAAINKAAHHNTILGFSLIGAIAASLFGFFGAIVARSLRRMVPGLIAGALIGAILGASAGCVGFLLNGHLEERSVSDAVRAVLVHAVEWSLVGIAAGLSAGLVLRDRTLLLRSACSGGFAGLIGGLMFVPLAMGLLPTSKPEYPLPEGLNLLLVFVFPPVLLFAIALARAQKVHHIAAD